MKSETMKFECPFGEDDDCPNEITLEVGEGIIEDAYGCLHVDPLTTERAARLFELVEERYVQRYDEAMESRVDQQRERDRGY